MDFFKASLIPQVTFSIHSKVLAINIENPSPQHWHALRVYCTPPQELDSLHPDCRWCAWPFSRQPHCPLQFIPSPLSFQSFNSQLLMRCFFMSSYSAPCRQWKCIRRPSNVPRRCFESWNKATFRIKIPTSRKFLELVFSHYHYYLAPNLHESEKKPKIPNQPS